MPPTSCCDASRQLRTAHLERWLGGKQEFFKA
jgi:hypothetical protein